MSTASQAKDEFNEATARYLDWLKSHNVDISPKITIHDYTSINQGRGVIALDNIKEGEVLATIPKTTLINVKHNLLVDNFPNLKHYLMRLPHWEALIIILLYELLNKQQSPWLEYINVLPQLGFDQLMFWSSNELNLLQPSCVLNRVGKEAAKEMFHKILDIVKDLKIEGLSDVTFEEYNTVATLIMSYSFDVELTKQEEKEMKTQLGVADEENEDGFDDEDDDVPELVQHGNNSNTDAADVKTLLERNGIPLDEAEEGSVEPVELAVDESEDNDNEESELKKGEDEGNEEEEEENEEEKEEEEEESDDDAESGSPEILNDGCIKSMVPLADTLNADTHYNNAVINYEENNLVITSIKAIKKGDQIFNTYSNHPNGEILRRYGYVEPQGSKGDFGEIPISIIYQFFIEKYVVRESELGHLLELIGEVSYQEQMIDDEDGGFELILDSYDCFSTGEVTIELVFLIQFLTTYLTILKDNDNNTVDITLGSVKRVYRKIYQLIESKKVTSDLIKNLTEIFEIRLDQYPDYASEPFSKDLETMTRDIMAKIVLQSEFQSLRACQQDVQKTVGRTLDASVKVVASDKLVRAIAKSGESGSKKDTERTSGEKRGNENEGGRSKKTKMRKN